TASARGAGHGPGQAANSSATLGRGARPRATSPASSAAARSPGRAPRTAGVGRWVTMACAQPGSARPVPTWATTAYSRPPSSSATPAARASSSAGPSPNSFSQKESGAPATSCASHHADRPMPGGASSVTPSRRAAASGAAGRADQRPQPVGHAGRPPGVRQPGQQLGGDGADVGRAVVEGRLEEGLVVVGQADGQQAEQRRPVGGGVPAPGRGQQVTPPPRIPPADGLEEGGPVGPARRGEAPADLAGGAVGGRPGGVDWIGAVGGRCGGRPGGVGGRCGGVGGRCG